jgi:pimeloyl-ACP methyl ester carboxylesterase
MRYTDSFFVTADALRLHFRDYPGSADHPPLLCLPGLTRNARDFEALAERYSPRFRALVLDYRGRGESDYDPQPVRYSPLTYAGDVQQLLDQLGVQQAIFVGTSLGGLVTMAVATLAPQRVAAAILNDVGPELDPAGIERIGSYVGRGERFADWEEAARAIAAKHQSVFPKYGPADWLAAARRTCREAGGAVAFDYDPAIAEAFAHTAAAAPVDLWPFFAALAQKPLLIVRGALSELLSAETARKMRAAAPNARFVEVPDVGHAPMLDEPEAVAAVDDFLGSLA